MIAKTPVVVLAPGHTGTGIARSLGRLGIPVYGVHTSIRSPAARSRYWRKVFSWDLATASDAESVSFLARLGREIGDRPLLIPTDDASCLFVADNAAALGEVFLLPDQPAGLARSVSSKQGMYELCQLHGIPTPETVFPRSAADVESFIENGRFPVMLKGVDTQALQRRVGIRMVVVENAEQLRQCYTSFESPDHPDLMIQEFIPGGPEAVWMFNGYFDASSRCRFGLTGKKLRQYPAYTGATSLGICIENADVADQTKRFMAAIGYRGILDIGYKYDARCGEYKLLDINPRIGSTFRLFVDSRGNDVARVQYADLTGQTLVIGIPREGRKWVNEIFDLASSWTYYRDGKLGPWDWVTSFIGVQEGSWFAIDDPRPMIAAGALGLRQVIERRLKRSPSRVHSDKPPIEPIADPLV